MINGKTAQEWADAILQGDCDLGAIFFVMEAAHQEGRQEMCDDLMRWINESQTTNNPRPSE